MSKNLSTKYYQEKIILQSWTKYLAKSKDIQ